MVESIHYLTMSLHWTRQEYDENTISNTVLDSPIGTQHSAKSCCLHTRHSILRGEQIIRPNRQERSQLTQQRTHSTQHTTYNTQHTTHNAQHTTHNTHNTQLTTHNTQHTTHNTQHTTHNTQHTTHNTQRTHTLTHTHDTPPKVRLTPKPISCVHSALHTLIFGFIDFLVPSPRSSSSSLRVLRTQFCEL
jgi:hydroxymethylpyrimidine/phosphomethylpyrimidine kinase